MSPVIIGTIGFILLFALLALGVPIGISMGVVGLAGLWHMFGMGSAVVKLVLVPICGECKKCLN